MVIHFSETDCPRTACRRRVTLRTVWSYRASLVNCKPCLYALLRGASLWDYA